MPIELLLKITGNKAVAIVRQNYNRLGVFALARATSAAMRSELTGEKIEGATTAREIVSAMNSENWEEGP